MATSTGEVGEKLVSYLGQFKGRPRDERARVGKTTLPRARAARGPWVRDAG